MTKADVTAVGQKLYSQGHTTVKDLAAAIAAATGPAGALYAGIVAADIVSKASKGISSVVAGASDAVGSVADAAGVVRDVAELPTRVFRWLGEGGTWVRISYVIIGAGLLLTSLAIVARGAITPAVTSVVKGQ